MFDDEVKGRRSSGIPVAVKILQKNDRNVWYHLIRKTHHSHLGVIEDEVLKLHRQCVNALKIVKSMRAVIFKVR